MKTEILEQIGLSKNEIKVYFALLELDKSSATPIVKKAQIPNSKVYPVLDKLISKGLVSFVIKNNVKYFQASSPENLIEILEDKEKEISLQKKEIEKIIPVIKAKRKMSLDKQEATIYEGLEGIKVAFNNILNTLEKNEEYYVFTLGEELKEEKAIRFFENYHKKRKEKKIKIKLISNTKLKEFILKKHKYSGMKFRFTDLNIPLGIFIYKNHVMTIIWKETPTAFVITSKNNYEHYKEFFEDVWGRSGDK